MTTYQNNNGTESGQTEKLAFDNKNQAEYSALTASWQHGSSLKAYHCNLCKLWHLASFYAKLISAAGANNEPKIILCQNDRKTKESNIMNYFITTSIPYVNGSPHVGHALEFIMADVLARNARAQGLNVLFSTGTDEHGSKVADKAAENKQTPKQYVDIVSQEFRDLAKSLNISNDRFIRTTDAGHEQRAQIIWKALEKDIYKGSYSGLYCVGCESFVTEAQAKEYSGVCPDHEKPYQIIEEQNYFFKLSKYSDAILTAIQDSSFEIVPERRKNEIVNVIKAGLDDISVSRPKGKVDWGIAVPGDDSQVMYVWFEALLNYITVLGYPEHQDFKTFWPANVQVIGKDIIRFHAAVWPGILLGLGLALPEKLFVHGFININGKKMSKSLGNFVTPAEILEKYSADVFRYFFLRYIPSYDDGDFSWEMLANVYNSDLANELGNTVQRTSAMIKQYQNGIIGTIPPAGHDMAQYIEAIAECRFDKALEEVWDQIKGLNRYIEETKPWEINKKGDKDHLQEVLAYQVSCLLEIAELLQPFLPETALKIRHIFEKGVIQDIEGTLFPRIDVVAASPK